MPCAPSPTAPLNSISSSVVTTGKTVRAAMLGLMLAAALTSVDSRAAEPQSLDAVATQTYNLPSGPLGRTLASFAVNAGIAMSFDPSLTDGLTSPALRGNYSARAAIAQLLAGSGLEVAMRTDGTYTLRKAAVNTTTDAEPPTSSIKTLSTLHAVDVAETATGPVNGYVAKRSATATKTDTPLIETPQSISVVGAAEIEALRAQTLSEALGYVAGVLGIDGAGRTQDEFVVRGFQAYAYTGSVYRDGRKYQVNVYNGQQEPYGLERIEVLKGAASVLYGVAAPGGVINTVSKRPTAEPLAELNVELGSFNRKQLSGDVSGAMTNDGTWSYRLTGLVRDADSFVDYVPDDRVYVAPTMKWQPGADTSFTLLSEYQHDRSMYLYGLPEQGTIAANPNGRIARSRFVGEPDHDQYDSTTYSVGYLFEHAFSEQLQLRHSLRRFDSRNDMNIVWAYGLDADLRTTLSRGAQDRNDRSKSWTTDTSLEYRWQTGGIAHTTIAGLDYADQYHQTIRYDRTAAPLDLFAPVYGLPLGEATPNGYSSTDRQKQLGFYVQDQMKLADRWVLLFGGRQDWVRVDGQEYFTGVSYADDEKSDSLTGRAGMVYLADNGLAPFISYSQSFEPVTGVDRVGERFQPTQGEQYELGLRYQPAGVDRLFSASMYQLTQQNVLVEDPTNATTGNYYEVQQGEVRSRGVELEARTRLGRSANLIAAYTYTDARTIKSSPLTPEQEGKRSGAVPYNQFSLWADYDFAALGQSRMKVGAGVRYVGSTTGISVAGEVPAYTVFDTMLSYEVAAWRVALNVTNLADKTYVASCTYACFYGEPRKVIVSAGYRW